MLKSLWSAIDIRRLFFSEIIWKEQSIMFYFSRATKRSQYLNTSFKIYNLILNLSFPKHALKTEKKKRKETKPQNSFALKNLPEVIWGYLYFFFFFYLGCSLISWHLGYQFLTFKDLFFRITSVKSSGFYIRPEFEHGWEKCYSST